jgi:hypothetical protein
MLSTNVLPIGRYSFFYAIVLDDDIYPALVLFEKSNFHWLDTVLLYTAADQDITFMVPDSCRATIRNGNSIRGDVLENIINKMIRTTLISALFTQFGC